MANADPTIKISYNISEPETSVIKTDIKTERLKDFLGDWLYNQMGRGGDERKANEKNIYKIIIRLDLSDDTFYTSSDTGNAGLTAGIVIHTRQILDKLKILPL